MGSFRKQKNKVLRLGVPLLFLAINILGAVAPAISNFVSKSEASAAPSYPVDTGDGHSYFIVHLQGVSDVSKYSIAAVPKATKPGFVSSLSFTYQASGPNKLDSDPAYVSGAFNWPQDPGSCNTATNQSLQQADFWTFTVYASTDTAHSGKSYGNGTFDGCGHTRVNTYNLVNINVSAAGQSIGSIAGTISFVSQVDGKTQTFGSTVNGANVTLTGPDGTVIKVVVDDQGHYSQGGLATGKYLLNGSYTNPKSISGQLDGKTYFIDKDTPITVTEGKTASGNTTAKTGVDVVTAPVGSVKTCDDGSDPDSDGNCPKNLDCGSGALNWIVCVVIDSAKSAAGVIDNMIMSSLDTDVKSIFDTTAGASTQNGYYTAWNSFRVIATALIVVAGLIMVTSQALGFEFLDAYTVRKVLPRLLIAIIGISLSWPLMRFVVQFFDTLGFDIRNLIYGPFSHLSGKISFATGALTWLGAGAAIFLLGPATLSFLVTAFFALLIGFLIIVFRQLAIVVLIILAPLAIAFYILPNTQKLWKLWYDNFLGLMLVFPIISAFIATGHVFSAVSLASSDASGITGSTLKQAIGLLAYFIPYFVLPLAFRLATGVIGSIAGFANDRGRGVFDRQKKKRQAAMADRIGRAKGESLYSRDTRRGQVANKLASWATAPGGAIAYAGRNKIPGLRRAGSRIESQIEHARVEQSGKLFENLNKMGYNDKAYRALSGIHRDLSGETQDKLQAAGLLNKAPASMAEIQKVGQILSQSSGETERIGGNAITGSAGYLANLYKDPEMGKASTAAAGIMGLAAHGFADGEDLAGAANTLMGGTFQAQTDAEGKVVRDASGKIQGNYEGGHRHKSEAAFAQSVVTQAQMLGARSRPDTKPGYGVVYDSAQGKWVDGMSAEGGRAAAVIKTLSSHDLAGAKGGAVTKLRPTIEKVIQSGGNDGRAVQDQLFSWAGPYSQASTDVKAQALDIIYSEKMSGKKDVTRTRKVRGEDGKIRTEEYIGWAEGSLADRFDTYARTESDPTERGEGGGPDAPPDPPPGGGRGGGGR